VYVDKGVFTLAGEATGIPWETIRAWVRSPKWADDLANLRLACAREVRVQFAAGAAAFVAPLVRTKAAAEARLAQIEADVAAGRPVDGKEIGSLLRAISSASESIARLGDVVETAPTDPAAVGAQTFVVKLEGGG
jgi:hypothetical protein